MGILFTSVPECLICDLKTPPGFHLRPNDYVCDTCAAKFECEGCYNFAVLTECGNCLYSYCDKCNSPPLRRYNHVCLDDNKVKRLY